MTTLFERPRFVLATIALVWWLALRLRGPGSAVVAALIYAVVSTDPFLFGHGAGESRPNNLPVALKGPERGVGAKVRRDSQGSLPKTMSSTYPNENAAEL